MSETSHLRPDGTTFPPVTPDPPAPPGYTPPPELEVPLSEDENAPAKADATADPGSAANQGDDGAAAATDAADGPG